jgi:hypothetical protein
MTVAELIEHLQACPPDLDVVVQSYEEGFDPVTDLRQLSLAETANKPWYLGVYEECASSDKQAVLIHSSNNRREVDNG